MTLTIRSRYRTGRTCENGWRHTEWHEYQVLDGRKIIGRFDTKKQAEDFVAEVLTAQERDDGR